MVPKGAFGFSLVWKSLSSTWHTPPDGLMRHAHHGGGHHGTHGHGVGHGGQTAADVSRKGKRDAINGRIFRQREIHGKRRLSVKVQQILAAKIKQDGGKVKRFFTLDDFF